MLFVLRWFSAPVKPCIGDKNLQFVYGGGMPRSRQIFLARSLLISTCRGTADDRPAGRFTKIE
jgi:hypothetical protein